MPSTSKQPSSLEEYFKPIAEDEEHDLGSSDEEPVAIKGKSRVPRLYEVKDERHVEAFRNSVSLADEENITMGERIASLGEDRQNSGIQKNVKFGPGCSREMSHISRNTAKYREDNEDKDDGEEGRRWRKREVDSLGLKKDGGGFRGRGRGSGWGRGSSSRGGRGRW
ncbi:hypothetical protein LINPERHAP1_LOCUS25906 [Linum perenne]